MVGRGRLPLLLPSDSTRRPKSVFELFIRKAHLFVELKVEKKRLTLEPLQVIIVPIIFPILVVSLIIPITRPDTELDIMAVVGNIS
jgi:hypothetical protein